MEVVIIHYYISIVAILVKPTDWLIEIDDTSNYTNGIKINPPAWKLSECGKYYIMGSHVFMREEVYDMIKKVQDLISEIGYHLPLTLDHNRTVYVVGDDGERHPVERDLYEDIMSASIAKTDYIGIQTYDNFSLLYNTSCSALPYRVIVGEHSNHEGFSFDTFCKLRTCKHVEASHC